MMTDTCGALRDIALLPFLSNPFLGWCVAPESTPITWISTEVVFAHMPILYVCLFWPLQALFSRNWFWLASHVVSASFTIISDILTSCQKMFLDAIDSRKQSQKMLVGNKPYFLCCDLFQLPHISPPRLVSQNWSKALQLLRTLLKRHQRQCTSLI